MADASLPLLLYELAKSGQDEFSILFDRFVGEVAERIEEYASRCFVGFSGSSECDLKFSFGHVFNPKTQQKIKIPAKTVVKFRVAKAAKDAVLGVKK